MKLMNSNNIFERDKLYCLYGNYPNVSARVLYIFSITHDYIQDPDQDMTTTCVYHGTVYHDAPAQVIVADQLVNKILMICVTAKEVEFWELSEDEECDMLVSLV
jgi:hypothetical protein